MKQIKMDLTMSLYGDMIRFKEDAANQKIKLGNAELESVVFLKSSFYDYVIAKLGIDVSKQKFSIDVSNKTVNIEELVPDKVPEKM